MAQHHTMPNLLSPGHHKLCGLCLSCTRLTTDEDGPQRTSHVSVIQEDVSLYVSIPFSPIKFHEIDLDRILRRKMKDMKVFQSPFHYSYATTLISGFTPSCPLFMIVHIMYTSCTHHVHIMYRWCTHICIDATVGAGDPADSSFGHRCPGRWSSMCWRHASVRRHKAMAEEFM